MHALLVLQVSFLLFFASLVALRSNCDANEICKHYKQCKDYQDTVKLIKLERNIVKRREIANNLWSRVCDRKKRFICCQVDEQRSIKLEKGIESPTYLPTQGECGKVKQRPTPLVSVTLAKHMLNKYLQIFGGDFTYEG